MDAGAAAFLIALGLKDRIVGTAAPDFKADFSGAMREQLDDVPVLSGGRGDKETVIAAKPDLVTGISPYEFGSFDGTPTYAQLRANGIAALVACDTSRRPVTTIDATYEYIRHLADLFHVPGRGKKIIASMKREAAARTSTVDGAHRTPVLTLSAVPTGGAGINTSGGASLTNGVITLAGGHNIAASKVSKFAALSAEEVARRNPHVIVAVTGFTSKTDRQLIDAIKSSPLLADTDAVKKDRVIAVPQRILLSPSLLNPRAIRDVAEAVKDASS
ncbi:ABC transporter substrate-binding protein [Streptomyces sp. NPDC046939]|uniref:ABC transporter substrate-binding protein n=1 Tax=Streptomyces sp. NPDC046939 TaxID=3155376 RepID=UPI0033F65F3A